MLPPSARWPPMQGVAYSDVCPFPPFSLKRVAAFVVSAAATLLYSQGWVIKIVNGRNIWAVDGGDVALKAKAASLSLSGIRTTRRVWRTNEPGRPRIGPGGLVGASVCVLCTYYCMQSRRRMLHIPVLFDASRFCRLCFIVQVVHVHCVMFPLLPNGWWWLAQPIHRTLMSRCVFHEQ